MFFLVAHKRLVLRKKKQKRGSDMGILNQIFGKKENKEENKEENKIEKKTEEIKEAETTNIEQQSGDKEEKYTFMVEQIFSVKDGGALVAGVVHGGKIKIGDEVYLLGRGKQMITSKVAGLDNPQTGKLEEAPSGSPVAILLENVLPEQVYVGDILTNEMPNTIDLEQEVTNPRIKGLMRQAAKAPTEEMMNLLYEEIAMNARFTSVILLSEEPVPNGDGTATFQEGATMQLPLLTAPDGARFYPAFTDKVELARWKEMKEPKTVLLSFEDHVALVLKSEETTGIVINPFSENMMLDQKILEHLKRKKELLITGKTKETVSTDTPMSFSDITEFPVELAKAISKVAQEENCIEQAWLRLMKKDGEMSYLLVVDVSLPGNLEAVFEKIAVASRPYLHGMLIHIVSYQSDFGKQATENTPSFYKRDV